MTVRSIMRDGDSQENLPKMACGRNVERNWAYKGTHSVIGFCSFPYSHIAKRLILLIEVLTYNILYSN